jgi:1,4-alpha-glucan branching enzyme
MVTFVFRKDGATQVSVCGQFNGWSPTATPMNRQSDGHWETAVALKPGRYEYKFVVDGDWLLDPAAPGSVPNDYGSRNSVLEVRA